MNTKHISLAFAAASVLLAGCAKTTLEDTGYNGQLADLELASIRSTDTKAAIDGTTFPTDGRIGLFLYEDEAATKPYGTGYENIQYSYNEAKGKWTASPSIKVGSTPGYLYGYYPYSSAATDVHAISVASSLNGDDVMYATPVKEVTDATASQTEITMNHALARVSIKVVNKGYTGEAKLSQIKFSGAETAQNGALNALDGSVTATKSDVTLDVPTADQTITTTGTTYECLLVPSDDISDKQTVALTLTIDGEDKQATLSGDNGIIIAKGTKSNITITLSDTGISLQTVSVEDWNVVEVGGHKVTITMANDVSVHDVLVDTYADGNDVIVKAYSASGQHLKCTMPDGGFCSSQSKTGNLVYTFTISDVTEDTTVTIGYASPVSIAVSPESSGSVETTSDAYEGETVTLKAMPAYEYGFDAWMDGDGNPLTCEEETYSNPVRLSAGCISVKFKKNLILDGVFTVADGKTVQFTRGNLYCSGAFFSSSNGRCTNADFAQWHLEQHQYDCGGDWDGGNRISHFLWSKDCAHSLDKTYSENNASVNDVFFTNSGSFTVSGISSSDYKIRTLTTEEWQYLFSYGDYDNDTRRGKYRCDVTVCEKQNCVVLLPDNWDGGTIESSYDYVGWKHMEAAGAVCLPAAGFCDGSSGDKGIYGAGSHGYYWSASPKGTNYAYALYFFSGYVLPSYNYNRNQAYSVRLVTECQ